LEEIFKKKSWKFWKKLWYTNFDLKEIGDSLRPGPSEFDRFRVARANCLFIISPLIRDLKGVDEAGESWRIGEGESHNSGTEHRLS